MDIVISALKTAPNPEEFFQAVKETFPSITAGVIAPGPGCNNFGFRINAPEDVAEAIANQLAMALMPAKWGRCDGDPLLEEGNFYVCPRLTK